MNRAKRLKPQMSVFVCILTVFGCDGNHDASQKETANTDNSSAPMQEKKVHSDAVTPAQPAMRLDPAVINDKLRQDIRGREERQGNPSTDADIKIYPERIDKTIPQPLDQAAITGIQTQAQNYYQSVDATARIQALEEIGQISSDDDMAVSTFFDALKDTDAKVRAEAVNQLSNSDQPEAVNGLISALNDSNSGVVIEALNNLAFMDDPALAEQISPLLASPDPEVSAAAAKTLEFLQE